MIIRVRLELVFAKLELEFVEVVLPAFTAGAPDLQILLLVVIAFADSSSSTAAAASKNRQDLVHPYSCLTSGSSLGTCPLVIVAASLDFTIPSSSIVNAFLLKDHLRTFAVDGCKVEHHIILLDSYGVAFTLDFDFHTFAAFNSNSVPDYFADYHSNRRRNHLNRIYSGLNMPSLPK